jgi:hypothetical protein
MTEQIFSFAPVIVLSKWWWGKKIKIVEEKAKMWSIH